MKLDRWKMNIYGAGISDLYMADPRMAIQELDSYYFFFKEDQNNFNRIWTYSDKTIMTNIGRVPTDLVHIKKTYVPTASSYGEEI